jgi:hypothetical protein
MKFPVFVALLAFCLIGCDLGRPGLRLHHTGDHGRVEEQRLISGQPGHYRLESPVLVSRTGQAFYLRYKLPYELHHGGGSSSPALQVLGSEDRVIASKALPGAASAGEATVYLPLKPGQVIRGFRIDRAAASAETQGVEAQGAEPQAVELLEAGVTDSLSGLENSGGRLSLGTTVSRFENHGRTIELTFSPAEDWPVRNLESGEAIDQDRLASPAEPGPAGRGLGRSLGWQVMIVFETRAAFSHAEFRVGESSAGQSDPSDRRELPERADTGGDPGREAAGDTRGDPGLEPAGDVGGDAGVDPSKDAGEDAAPDASEPERSRKRASVLLRLRSAGKTSSFRHTALSGRHTVYLYSGMVPVAFEPEILEIEALGGGAVWLRSCEAARLPLGRGEGFAGSGEAAGAVNKPDGTGASGEAGSMPAPSVHPLPAGPGAVLLYDPRAWRQPEYELFSWSRFPDILIMDTASYRIQSRFFKRLAFFVEKRGYRGRLVSDREFAGLHGFNAHDYRAEDLARFFQTAREKLFVLNPEEELLKHILLANGIIRDQGTFSPGKGGILSISQSSYPLLRRHLLTHESCHGLFFSLPDFRQASFAAWEGLSQQEKDFWTLFFRWVGYDTDDSYLTVNEYQAYLFQQPRSGVPYYFNVLTASRLTASYPGEASWVRELIRSDPHRFTRDFDSLERSLVRIAGVEGGRIIELGSAEAE